MISDKNTWDILTLMTMYAIDASILLVPVKIRTSSNREPHVDIRPSLTNLGLERTIVLQGPESLVFRSMYDPLLSTGPNIPTHSSSIHVILTVFYNLSSG